MKFIKPLLVLLIAFYTYTMVDIQIWQNIFEANEAWSFSEQYREGWQVVFWGLFIMGFVLLLPDMRAVAVFGVSFYLMSVNGTEDVFYYWLNGRQLLEYDNGFVADEFHWLNDSVWFLFRPLTPENVIANVMIQGVCLAMLWFLLYRVDYRE